MAWQQLILTALAETDSECIEELLSNFDEVAAITLQDGADQPIFEPTPAQPVKWNSTNIIALMDSSVIVENVVSKLQAELQQPLSYRVEQLENEDWERRYLEQFQPIEFANRLCICPSWHDAPNNNYAVVKLDPGLAFGTGTHPTTQLCLQWLAQHLAPGSICVDYGCGSGILGIAAKKLGAKTVLATDIDPQALQATQQNLDLNPGLENGFVVTYPEELPNLKADVVIANILANPLIALSTTLASLVKPGGFIVLSGILVDQEQKVRTAYQKHFSFEPAHCMDEWLCLVGQHK